MNKTTLADCAGGSPCTSCKDKRQCGETGCIRQPEFIHQGRTSMNKSIDGLSGDDMAAELEAFRRKHWTHWNAAENLLVSHAVSRVRCAALLASPAPAEPPPTIKPGWQFSDGWQMFVCYLIDKCEGEMVSEEMLHRTAADFLRNPQYAMAAPLPVGDAPSQQQPQASCLPPAGSVLVPREPTLQMAKAALEETGMWVEPQEPVTDRGWPEEDGITQEDADRFNAEAVKDFATTYRAILNAAPQSGETEA